MLIDYILPSELAELHGGKVEVVSTKGVGSTFRGYIACSRDISSSTSSSASTSESSPAPMLQSDSLGSTSIGTSSANSSSPRKRLRVLAVDDNAVNRKIVRRQLEMAGHNVEQAVNGQECVDRWLDSVSEGGTKLDVVLLDIEMPLKNGLEAAKDIREAESQRGMGEPIRIVGLTSNAREAQVAAGIAAGMNLVVTKPYRVEFLLNQLTAASKLKSPP